MNEKKKTKLMQNFLKEFTDGKITRREFMGRMAMIGVATTLPLSFAGKKAMAATPKKGGRLRVGIAHGSTTETYDPATIESGFQAALSRTMTNTLTEIDADNKVIPCLAESWDSTADASTWTFKIRKGVEFHNGKSLTAKDVIASMNYHRGKDSKSSVKPLTDPIVNLKADGDYTVVFELNGGNADFPFNLDTEGFAIYPAAKDGSLDWKPGIATGAYILKNFEPGIRATFVRNPNYWKEGRGHFDEVELNVILDTPARTTALVTGSVDVIEQVDLKSAHLLAQKAGIHIEETSGPLHYTFPMLSKTAPFDDNNVRLAIKFAIDREEMLKLILRGHGTIGNDTPIGPSYRYYAKELEQNSYDPDKAKFYLKKSGLSSLSVNLSAADAAFAGAVDAAVLYKEQAARAGINIKVVRESNDGYWSNVWLKKPWCACYWGGYSTEDNIFSTGYAPKAAWNDTQWDNARFNKLMVEARGELDEVKRREMYVEMQRILRDEGGAVIPLFANAVLARNDKVAHGKLASNGRLDNERIAERWWKA